jgi:menaquinone-specific isochorismate synthase
MLCQPSIPTLTPPQDCKQIYQFINFCKQQSVDDDHFKVASVALGIPMIDPLMVMRRMRSEKDLHFYVENRDEGRAIAAMGAALVYQSSGTQRFKDTQQFTQDCLKHLITSGADALGTPHFFASFTFSDQESDSYFAPATIFLPQWQIIRNPDGCAFVANFIINAQSDCMQLTDRIWQQFQTIRTSQYSLNPPHHLPMPDRDICDTHNFRAAVVTALDSIQKQQIDKLVLAHAVDVRSPLPFQWAHSLHNLRQRHPDCTVFSVGNGRGQSFIGASPERILSIHHHQLVTDALAGSSPRGRSVIEDADLAQRLMSSDKERREHQVVVDFIAQRLIHLGLQPTFTESPSILQLSNIQHLHTPIHTAVPSHIHPLDILAELHPTPAVAGMPREIACQQIRRYENFGRSLYAAPLGWIDAQGNAEFVVGIRSALLDGYCARLYAGAGIVAGSDPDRELAEIKLKFQTLLQALV